MKTAIVSTIYPDCGGVATYTQYLYREISKLDFDAVVFAKKKKGLIYNQEGVRAVWSPDLRFVFQVLTEAIRTKVQVVHIQQELHLFGPKVNIALLSVLIPLLRACRIKVVMTLHGVVPLQGINRSFLQENGYSGNAGIMRFLLKALYSGICLFANKIIVHEQKFREYLEAYYVDISRVTVIGHGVKTPRLIGVAEARSKLGIDNKYTFLYLGYVTGYKGLENIIEALQCMTERDFNFIVVGSRHPRLRDDADYEIYYDRICRSFKTDTRCSFFAYANEEDIDCFFRASDCAVFPYTLQMSSSGPMALAIANETLVIGSHAFDGVLPEKLIFQNTAEGLVKKMREAKSGELHALAEVKQLKSELSWDRIAKKTITVWQAC